MRNVPWRLTSILTAALVAVAALSLLIIAPDATAAKNAPQPARAPVLQSTPEPVSSESAWNRVRAANVLMFGTSADYPPFAYYNDNFQLDGLDVALALKLAEKLGVPADIKDIAFEGLPGALQVGQVDAIIAAMAITPERQQTLDFSDVYYISEDAILSRAGSDLDVVDDVQDLAGKRVGVQRATIFEDWLVTSLVETGLTDATNIFAYTDADLAVNDLKRGRVDAVVMDLEPAKSFAGRGGVRLVGEGLNRQMFAIALPKGQPELLELVNRALEELKAENVIATLVQQYIGQDSADQAPLPTPTPPPCIDAMAYVSDLTYDDSIRVPVVPRGQPFQKGWRVRNAGTCSWLPGYSLTFAGGDQMGGVSAQIVRDVAPGETVDLFVNLTAPATPGRFRGFWQMQNSDAQPFGERIWVSIETPAPPTPTPPPRPPQPQGTSIDFRAGRTNIRQGECVNIGWDVRNATAVYFYREGNNWQDHPAVGQESRTVCPPYTSKHLLRVVRPDGGVEMREITIYVESVANPPAITRLETVPTGNMPADQCTDVRWDVQGDVTRVILTRNGNPLWDSAPLRASLQDCPPPGKATYQIEAQGPGGTVRRSVDLFINSR